MASFTWLQQLKCVSHYIGIELGQIGRGRFEGRATIVLRLDTTGNVTVSKLLTPPCTTHFYGQRVAIINHLSRGALTDPKKKNPYNAKVSQANKPKTLWGAEEWATRSLHSIDRQTSQTTLNGLFVCFGEFRSQNVGGKSIINDVNCQFLPHKQRGQNRRIKIERTLRPCTTY